MSARLYMLLAVTVSIGMVSFGCGGDEKPASASVFSKAEFIKQANAACERERAGLMERISSFERRRAPGRPLAGADMVHLVYLPTMETQMWRIEELGVPRGEGGRIDAMLDAERFAVDAVAVIPRVPSRAAAERHFAEADKLFRAYGLHSCATGNEP